MRFKPLSLFLVFLISACTFQMEVFNTPTPQASSIAIVPSPATSTPMVNPDVSATPPLAPTLVPTNTFLPTHIINPSVSASPIQFSPNGTYVDVLDSISAGKSKAYSVKALQGQVMSVSIHQNEGAEWSYVTVTVLGKDGTRLCEECEFWRGVLPSTQDYLLALIASGDARDFTLRVAINPPGMATQSLVYENIYRNASLSYTDMFAPALFPNGQVTKIKPELALQFIDTQSFVNTNLLEAYFLFGSSTDPQVISTCTEIASFGGPETVVGNVTINGVTLTKSQATGVGAGNVYEQTYYRTVHNGTCYEITYFIHYGNIGNYDPGTVKEFDRAGLLQKFEDILATVTFK